MPSQQMMGTDEYARFVLLTLWNVHSEVFFFFVERWFKQKTAVKMVLRGVITTKREFDRTEEREKKKAQERPISL